MLSRHTLLVLLAGASLTTLARGAAAAEATDTAATSTAVSGVTVTAPRQEVKARVTQFQAPNLINVQAAETIQKYPDFNAAEALGRMPGVSISTDTGEGRFVNIRGIDGNLAGATFGGVPLLNTYPGGTYFGGGGRAVEFDTIPTGSVDGLVVTFTPLPDHEAESLGGTVELTPRTAINIDKPFFEGEIGWGDEPEHNHTGPFNIAGAAGVRFGFNNGHLVVEGDGQDQAPASGWITNPTPFSIVLTASRRDDRRGFDDIEEDYNDPTVDREYQDIQLRHYDYHRRRFGYGGEFDFKPNDDHRYYFRANVAGYTESVIKNRLTYDDSAYLPGTPTGSGFTTLADTSEASTQEQETHRNQVYVVGGVDQFGGVVLDYRASYSRATYHQDYNYGANFSGPTIPFYYNNSGNNGNYPVLTGNNSVVDDPANWSPINKVKNSTESDRDSEWAYAVNLLVPLHALFADDSIKFGGEVRLRDKDSTPYAYTSVISPLSLASASSPAITNFYGQYSNGPLINTIAVQNAYRAGTITGGVDLSSVFSAKEDIYAGYAEYLASIGKFSFVAGVRVEATDATYGAYSDDNAAETFEPVSRKEDYINAFPSLQLKYELAPNMLVRAIYSTGIGRPGFLQNTASSSSNHDLTDPQISTGNPNLKPTTGNDFDLSFEYYLPNGGVLQLSAFDKEFKNYIVTEYQRLMDTTPGSEFQGLVVGYTTYANRNDAYARGIQAAYHQQFTFLPGAWSGLGIESNVTLVDSHIQEYDAATDGNGVAESGLLPGTSRLTWNLAGFYEKYGFQARVAAEYVSHELFSLGGTKASDTIQDDRLTLDFTSSYNFYKHYSVYFNVKNITNAPLRFYVYNASFPIQREYYDQTYEAGLRVKF